MKLFKQKLIIMGKASVNRNITWVSKEILDTKGKIVQLGFTDKKGNWIVTENEVDGEIKTYPLHEIVKTWERKFEYIKFANDEIIVNKKEN